MFKDDTAIVMQDSKWDRLNNSKQRGQVDMECRRMRDIDDTIAPPFEGKIRKPVIILCNLVLNSIL